MSIAPKNNQWLILLNDVKEKAFTASTTPAFCLSFIFVIVGIGSIGLWLPPVRSDSVDWIRPDSYLTYSMPILTTIIAEIILRDTDSKDFNILCFVLCLMSISCAVWCVVNPQDKILNVIGLFLVFLVLLLKTSNDDKYLPAQSEHGPTGGEKVSSSNLSVGE